MDTTNRRQVLVAGVSALTLAGSPTSAQEKEANQLLDLAILAHGGAKRWGSLFVLMDHVWALSVQEMQRGGRDAAFMLVPGREGDHTGSVAGPEGPAAERDPPRGRRWERRV